ncbi:hypothetical protein RB653_001075 [Dictyostelium firmibasis]|uniref:DUF885 family protein n=1 Tax=Dictyostelium firmibasis TaxID=79012 RepID=A0AAN7YYE8_9MYCE
MLRFNFKHLILAFSTLIVFLLSIFISRYIKSLLLSSFDIDIYSKYVKSPNQSMISYFRIEDESVLADSNGVVRSSFDEVQLKNQIETFQDKNFHLKSFLVRNQFYLIFVILQCMVSIVLIPNLYFTPFTLKILVNRFTFEFLQHQYIILTKIRIFEHYGINSQNRLLDDLSLSFRKKQKTLLKKNLNFLKSFKSQVFKDLEQRKDNSIQNWITYTTMEWFLTTSSFGYDLMIYIYPLFIYNPLIYPTNQFRGCIVAYVKTLTIIQRLSTESEIMDYIKRIRHSEEYIDGCIIDLKKREKKGVLPCVNAIIGICKHLEKTIYCEFSNPKNHFIYKLVSGHLQGLPEEDICEQKKKELLSYTQSAIVDYFMPAIRKLIRYHYSLIPMAPKEIGLWRIPNGDDIYRFHIYYFTSTTMHPMELQELGLKEIESCKKKIIELVQPEFIFCEENETFGDFIRRISNEPDFHFPFTKKGRRDAVHQLKRSITTAWEKSKELFNEYPESPINIDYYSIFSDVSYNYQPGPWDGSENPKISINFDREITYSKLMNKGCAFREGVPGHHLQLEAFKNSKLDFFRKNFISNSFFNGWGLYAELLTIENGWMESKWEELGHYLLDLRISAKLVVDSSIHYQGIKWDTKTACSFFEEIGFNSNEAELEVKCLSSLPGTGLSQKVGQVKLLEMREFAKQELGEKFDIKEFHSVILENGSLPLDILAQVNQYWIIEKKNNNCFPSLFKKNSDNNEDDSNSRSSRSSSGRSSSSSNSYNNNNIKTENYESSKDK